MTDRSATTEPAPLERDLSFKPAAGDHLTNLTPAQIDAYNERGYLTGFSIFNDEEVKRNRDYFDSLLAAMNRMNDGRSAYAINCYQGRCRGIYDLATEPRILDYVQDIVGPDIICWATHFFCKLPHDTKHVPWHQDASYWDMTPARTVTVWLAIDDADVENACMYVIPETHRKGHLKWKRTDKPAVLDQEIVDIESFGEPAPIELKAGRISLHADMLVHGSQPNRSNRRRCGLTLRYCPPYVQPTGSDRGANVEPILCRGKDTHGHWNYRTRPAGDDISNRYKPKSVGGN